MIWLFFKWENPVTERSRFIWPFLSTLRFDLIRSNRISFWCFYDFFFSKCYKCNSNIYSEELYRRQPRTIRVIRSYDNPIACRPTKKKGHFIAYKIIAFRHYLGNKIYKYYNINWRNKNITIFRKPAHHQDSNSEQFCGIIVYFLIGE